MKEEKMKERKTSSLRKSVVYLRRELDKLGGRSEQTITLKEGKVVLVSKTDPELMRNIERSKRFLTMALRVDKKKLKKLEEE